MSGQLDYAAPLRQVPASRRRRLAPHPGLPKTANDAWGGPRADLWGAQRPEGGRGADLSSVGSTHAADSDAACDEQVPVPVDSSTDGTTEGEGLSAAIIRCARRGDLREAEDLFHREESMNKGLTVDTYNAILRAYMQHGETSRVEGYINCMAERGLEPNVMTYNIAINACAESMDARGARAWLKSMVQHGMRPNIVTYGTICKALARLGAIEQIEHIMKLIKDSGILLNEFVYASLIVACGAADPPDPARAERAMEELICHGLRPQRVKRAFARVVGNSRMAQVFEAYGRSRALSARGEESGPLSGSTGSTAEHAEVEQPPVQKAGGGLDLRRLSLCGPDNEMLDEMFDTAAASQPRTKAYVPGEVLQNAAVGPPLGLMAGLPSASPMSASFLTPARPSGR